jgi:hypothetical protein
MRPAAKARGGVKKSPYLLLTPKVWVSLSGKAQGTTLEVREMLGRRALLKILQI